MSADVSATLAGIKERNEQVWHFRNRLGALEAIEAAKDDVPRLVAALEAVLEWHGPGRFTILGSLCKRHEQHRHFSITRTEAADVTACPDCTADVYVSCGGCGPHVRLDACPDREAVTRELAKEADR